MLSMMPSKLIKVPMSSI